MSSFHLLKIKEIRQETPDCVSIAFDIPENLKKDYLYREGQYITLKLTLNGSELRRSYSICSSPYTENELRVAVKKVKNGLVSIFLNEKLKTGDQIDVLIPHGNFHSELNKDHAKSYVLFAGGSGITPVISIIKSVLAVEAKSKLILFYANRDASSVIFKNQLEDLKSENPDRLHLHYIYESGPDAKDELHKGQMSTNKAASLIEKYLDTKTVSEVFICGPAPMMENVKSALLKKEVEQSKIHIEYFSSPIEAKEKESKQEYCNSHLKIILDAEETEIELKAGETVLDAALKSKIDAPYSCRSGSCSTCRAKLIEGKVKMKVNYSLLESEIAEGIILTCQAHPLTPQLIVDFDKGR